MIMIYGNGRLASVNKMKPAWNKIGRIIKAEGQHEWMMTHTAVPIPYRIGKGKYRIFFGTRDANNHSSIGFVDIDIDAPLKIRKLSHEPALKRGDWGMFDDNGVYPGPVVNLNGKPYMYYSGRSNGVAPLFYMAIGLAATDNEGEYFKRVLRAPLLGRSEEDPWMVSTPFIRKEGTGFRMWYLSGIGWKEILDNPQSYYHLKTCFSEDGFTWKCKQPCVSLDSNETNISCPTVVKINDRYCMWYSRVSDDHSYRLGFSVSSDGLNWTRRDKDCGIELSETGWDSQAMAYPYVFEDEKGHFMLYSGGHLGREGIGIAKLE